MKGIQFRHHVMMRSYASSTLSDTISCKQNMTVKSTWIILMSNWWHLGRKQSAYYDSNAFNKTHDLIRRSQYTSINYIEKSKFAINRNSFSIHLMFSIELTEIDQGDSIHFHSWKIDKNWMGLRVYYHAQ